MVEPLLKITGLRKNFGALAVTDNVDLSIKAGELHALIGPNGAGKTTLMNLICGSVEPDAGKIILDETDVTALSTSQRAKLGMARSFQITSILPDFSVLENVAISVQAKSGSSYRFWKDAFSESALNKVALAALDQVGLADRAGIKAGQLSHGEKRSLEIAMALALTPKLLLLDEPMAGMGHDESAKLTELLLKLKGKYGILLVEHDMQAVFALADCVSVLVYGQIIARDTPAAIRENAAVKAAYLGEEEFADA